MAKEAAFKSTRVIHANVRQATPAWTNSNRVNKANQFTPRPETTNLHVSSGTHIKSGTSRVNAGKQNVNSGTKNKSGSSRVNTGKQNANSGKVYVNTARITRPVLSNRPSTGPILKIIKNLTKWDLLLLEEVKEVSVEKIENQLNQKVKIIRSDNGTEFKNRGTLIDAARPMLADSPLAYHFMAEASILHAIPSSGPLGKFDGKSDEGFLVGYSVNSKAFRVYNLVTKRVEVNLHVNFSKRKNPWCQE
ncbi:hypothetical protein Tco_0133470 [Tanacetum coccineum]